MMKRTSLGLGLAAISLLTACQTDPRVTSVAPAFQSAESQALRSHINGTTVSWSSGDTKTRKGCIERATFARDGTFTWQTRCNTASGKDAAIMRPSGDGYVFEGQGSWAVRDEQVCFNIFRINGERAVEALQKVNCWGGQPMADSVALTIGRVPIIAKIVSRS